VKLSAKKVRRILKRARGRPAEEVARELGLPLEAVERALAEGGARVATPGDVADGIERALPWAIASVAGVAPFAVIPRGQYNPSLLPQSVFIAMGSFAAVLAWLVAGALRGRLTVRRTPLLLPGLVFLGWALLSLAWAHNGRAGLERLVLWSACAAAYIVALNSLRSPDDRRRLMIALASSGAVAAGVGLAQYYFRVDWFPQVVSPASTFGNKNFAAQYMVLTLPAAAALFLNESRPKVYWPAAGAIVLTGAMTFHAFSKAAWLAAGVGLGLFGALVLRAALRGSRPSWSRGRTAASLAAGALLLLAVNTGPDGFEFRIAKAFGALGDVAADATSEAPPAAEGAAAEADAPGGGPGGLGGAPSLGIRVALWKNTLAMVRDHPVAGVGLGNFRIEFPPYSNRVVPVEWFGAKLQPKNAHNDFLQVLAELGIVGFGLMVWLLVAAVRATTRALKSEGKGNDVTRYAAPAAAAGGAGLLVTAVFSFPFGTAVAPFTFAVLLGLLGSIGTAGAETEEGERKGSRGERRLCIQRGASWALAGVALVSFLLAAWSGYHRIAADRHFNTSRMSSASDVVIAEAAAALRHDPGLADAHLFAARGYLARHMPRNAVACLKALLEAQPHSMAAMTNLGGAYARAGQHEKAVECALRVLEMKPGSANAHSNLGYHYLDLQRSREAEGSFRAALRNDPGFAPAHFGLGRLALEEGKGDEALALFRTAARLSPGKAVYHDSIGRLARDRGDLLEAVEEFAAAARLSRDARAYCQLGNAAFEAKLYERAADAFRQATKLRPGWAPPHKSLGTLLMNRLGRAAEGVEHYRKALLLDPKIDEAGKLKMIIKRWDALRRE
jgi:tetratricopeptide (TPR) repeat protein/O-antigen ligase